MAFLSDFKQKIVAGLTACVCTATIAGVVSVNHSVEDAKAINLVQDQKLESVAGQIAELKEMNKSINDISKAVSDIKSDVSFIRGQNSASAENVNKARN